MKITLAIAGGIVLVTIVAVLAVSRSSAGGRDVTFPRDRDGAVLRRLHESGSDLSKPHDVEFFLYFPTEKHALAAAMQIGEPFAVKVDNAADGSQWLVLATQAVVPEYHRMADIRQRLESVAEKFDGEYDGWGTSVVE